MSAIIASFPAGHWPAGKRLTTWQKIRLADDFCKIRRPHGKKSDLPTILSTPLWNYEKLENKKPVESLVANAHLTGGLEKSSASRIFCHARRENRQNRRQVGFFATILPARGTLPGAAAVTPPAAAGVAVFDAVPDDLSGAFPVRWLFFLRESRLPMQLRESHLPTWAGCLHPIVVE